MPRRDATGPVGAGAMTGRGLGACNDNEVVNQGNNSDVGQGCRRGQKRGLGRGLGRGFNRGTENPIDTTK